MRTVFFMIVATYSVLHADDIPVFIKQSSKTKKLSPAKLKESICSELEALLTLSSDLIAFLAEGQRAMISKMHCVIAPEKGEFFSDAKAKELDLYLQELSAMRQELEISKQKVEERFKKLKKDFTS